MKIEKFAEEMKTRLEKKICAVRKIDIQNVLKNNSVVQTTLIVKEQGKCIAPTIYLDRFYEDYKKGADLDKLENEMLELYNESRKNERINLDFVLDWEQVKDSVVFKIINTQQNLQLLENVPHDDVYEYSKVYYLSLFEGRGSMLIYKSHCDMWGITEEELKCIAEKNTPKLLPPSLKLMSEIMSEMLELINDTDDEIMKENIPLYVLSNESRRMGAAVICYPNCLKNVAEELQSDFYMIPSCVHEMTILPVTLEVDVEYLKALLKMMNGMYIGKEEVLGEQIYLYKREEHELILVE